MVSPHSTLHGLSHRTIFQTSCLLSFFRKEMGKKPKRKKTTKIKPRKFMGSTYTCGYTHRHRLRHAQNSYKHKIRTYNIQTKDWWDLKKKCPNEALRYRKKSSRIPLSLFGADHPLLVVGAALKCGLCTQWDSIGGNSFSLCNCLSGWLLS